MSIFFSTPNKTQTGTQMTAQSNDRSDTTDRPVKLRNLLTDEQMVDNLHCKYKQNNKSPGCIETRCLGSLMNPRPAENRVRSISETWEQAKDFIDNYYASIKRLDSPAHKRRLQEIEDELKTTDTYYLKETELIYGAKLAWRNASRCIGRIQWSKLQVFDARVTTNANEMFEAICNHIKYATNKGSLRSAITIMPQRVKSTKNDWRIWNGQLIGYAGYRNKDTGDIVGDPANADFTEVCQKLGWQGKGGRFDILPLVLSAAGGPPQLFPLPEELIMRVKIKHPKYKWFKELGLEWYALPAVSGMMLDVGGLQFTAAPFSGWYMVTEIGTRDLGDTSRYNMLEEVALRMGLNTKSNLSLWKDQALVELNLAVLDSFQSAGVTIVDHHTASETFMTHLANEQRLRGGCPADWVWLVPPTAGSTTQVYHQEMLNYHLLPNYEYMEPMHKSYDWLSWDRMQQEKLMDASRALLANGTPILETSFAKHRVTGLMMNGLTPPRTSLGANGELTPRKIRFKEIARAVKFTSKLFGKALSRRIKATILYATETGKSERFANKLAQTFSNAFNVHLMNMADYDMTCLEHEALLLIVTSTFGNGDPPENGELFAKHLAAVKITGDTSPDIDSINSVSTNPFFQMLSQDQKENDPGSDVSLSNSNMSSSFSSSTSGGSSSSDDDDNHKPRATQREGRATGSAGGGGLPTSESAGPSTRTGNAGGGGRSGRLRLRVSQQEKMAQQTNVRPLSNVRFSVFALGSTAYPHFCAFGRYVDQTLGELGAERIDRCTCGDELCGQEKAFNEWSSQVFRRACDVFCLTDSIGPIDERPELAWSPNDVRFVPVELIDGASDSPATPLKHNPQASSRFPVDTSLANTPIGEQAERSPPAKSSSLDILTSKSAIMRNLMNMTNKKIIPMTVMSRRDIHPFKEEENLQTICIELESDMVAPLASPKGPFSFEPGDHIAVYPTNRSDIVDRILMRMESDLKLINADSSAGKAGRTSSRRLVNFDQVYTILVKRECIDLTPGPPPVAAGPTSEENNWMAHDRLPVTSIREALIRYLDITGPPNQEFLLLLSRQASDQEEKKRLQQMAKNFTLYEEWKNRNVPTLLSTLDQFRSIRFDPALVTQIPLLKPRFYSVSGTSISLTVGVVRFTTLSGEQREGLCSNYLNMVQLRNFKSPIYGYIRSAPAFHMPQDKGVPLILISAGTGIAPFRSFWQQRYADMYKSGLSSSLQQVKLDDLLNNGPYDSLTGQPRGLSLVFGSMDLYFGCRNSNYILYKEELDEMYDRGVLSSVNVAFSRPIERDIIETCPWIEPSGKSIETSSGCGDLDSGLWNSTTNRFKVGNIKQQNRKMYVQDKLLEDCDHIFRLIMFNGAHIYVCGDVAMADGVYKTLASIINASLKADKLSQISDPLSGRGIMEVGKELAITTTANKSLDDGESVLMNLRNLNRYHEDIFGAKQAT